MSELRAVAVIVCDGWAFNLGDVLRFPCPAECAASAPIREGADRDELDRAHRAARRAACVIAESLGWHVSRSGEPVRDLCPTCAASKHSAASVAMSFQPQVKP